MISLMRIFLISLIVTCSGEVVFADDGEIPKKTTREALKPLQDLIGSWRCTGQVVQGTSEQREKGAWSESFQWEWQFREKDSLLKVEFNPGKYFRRGTIRYDFDRKQYLLEMENPDRRSLRFEGELKGNNLVFLRVDPSTQETQRLSFRLLHSNRLTYRYEVKSPDRTLFVSVYQVGATKNGVEFASSDGKQECIVSGGLGTIPVVHQGVTYYVCCTGCKTAFLDDPVRYLKEWSSRQTKKP